MGGGGGRVGKLSSHECVSLQWVCGGKRKTAKKKKSGLVAPRRVTRNGGPVDAGLSAKVGKGSVADWVVRTLSSVFSVLDNDSRRLKDIEARKKGFCKN